MHVKRSPKTPFAELDYGEKMAFLCDSARAVDAERCLHPETNTAIATDELVRRIKESMKNAYETRSSYITGITLDTNKGWHPDHPSGGVKDPQVRIACDTVMQQLGSPIEPYVPSSRSRA